MSGQLLVDWLVDRVKSWGAPLPRGTRMSPADTHPDRAELRQLLDRHAEAWDGFAYNNDEDRRGLAAAIVTVAAENAGWPETSPFLKHFAGIVDQLLLTETAFQPYSLPAPITALSLLDVGEIADDMRHRIEIISDSQLLIPGLVHVSHIIEATLAALPASLGMSTDMPFPLLTVDLVATAERPHDVMTFALATFMRNDDFDKTGLFRTVRRQLYRNTLEASGVLINPDLPLLDHDTDNPILPFECKREPAMEVADRYFGMTPLADLFCIPLPLTIPDAIRFEHMHILAGTGHGKTQTLQHLIVADLLRPADEVPAMVVLDSQGDMLDVLKRIRLFDPAIEGNAYAERLLIVDPSDVHFTPALNLFDIQSDRLAGYDLRDREQVLAGIIEIYDYIFGGLLGAELTQKQSMVFRFLAQLMLAIPGSTIHTLRELLEDASPYADAIASLPDTARGFFENHFFGKGYQPTREQILRRLYGVLQNPSFERMFAHPRNRLDLFDVLNRGGIVLVNTAKDFLKSEASSIFGRFIIALTLKAAMERATLRPDQRRPTFLWIDEASEYFDDTIDNLLIQARKFNLGLVMAHQYLGQLPRGLPASIMTNTSIKLAGGISDRDARVLSPEMRTTPDFLSSMTKDAGRTNFAAYIRNVTPQALRLTVPFGTAEGLDQMPPEHLALLIARSRLKLAEPPLLAGPTAAPSVADEDTAANSAEHETTADDDADELEHHATGEDDAFKQAPGEDVRAANAATDLLHAASEADATDTIVADDVADPPAASRLDSAPAVAGPEDGLQSRSQPSSKDPNSPTSSKPRNDTPRPPSAPKPTSKDDDPWESF